MVLYKSLSTNVGDNLMKGDFIASDGWCVEENTAWFIGTEYNAIFKVDLISLECKIICHLPIKNVWKSRQNPRCVKVGNYIVCLPSFSTSIYVYDIEDDSFQEIEVDTPENESLSIYHYWCDAGYVFAFSRELQRVLTIDVINKKTFLSKRIDERISAMYAIKVGQCLWLPNSLDNRIFSYNLYSGEVKKYLLSNVKGKLYAICYDGEHFWITGNRQEIYVWKKEENLALIIKEFPEKFTEYTNYQEGKVSIDQISQDFKEPLFNHCIFLNNSIWCIPFQTNMILKINKNTYTVSGISDDETANEVLSRDYNHKYLLDYVRNDRYIGLFSLRMNCIFELDTKHSIVKKKNYYLTNEEKIDRNFPVFSEAGINNFFYCVLLRENESNKNNVKRSIGEEIYERIVDKH